MQQCESCGVGKVFAAFESGSKRCRDCVVDAKEGKPQPEKAGKRPATLTIELSAAICEAVAMRQSLRDVCASPDMPTEKTVARWRLENEEFAAALDRARQARADARADRVDAILDDLRAGRLDAQVARVLVDGELRLAGKDNPKKYSDRFEVTGAGGEPLTQVNAAVAIEALIASLPDLAGEAHHELLPSSPLLDDGAGEAAGACRRAPAASSQPDESAPAAHVDADDFDLSDDEDGYETPARAA